MQTFQNLNWKPFKPLYSFHSVIICIILNFTRKCHPWSFSPLRRGEGVLSMDSPNHESSSWSYKYEVTIFGRYFWRNPLACHCSWKLRALNSHKCISGAFIEFEFLLFIYRHIKFRFSSSNLDFFSLFFFTFPLKYLLLGRIQQVWRRTIRKSDFKDHLGRFSTRRSN